jgi:hypothetical protein
MQKQAKKQFFFIKAKKFRFRFDSFRFEVKMMAVFRFHFASFSFQSENDGSFSLLFRLVFASFHFRFASDFYVSHRCETSKKTLFLHQSENNFASVSLYFAS